MRVRLSVPDAHADPHVINAILEGVTRLDESLIRSGQSPTSRELVAAGAIWRPEPPGDEHFDHGGTIAQRGWGDCDDWAPLHAATLRASGEDPGAKAIVVPSGPDTYHAIVERSDGSLDDPSVAAGMKPIRNGKVEGAEGIHILACDPHDPSVVYAGSLLPTTSPMSLHCGPTFNVRQVQGAWQARADLPLVGSPLVGVRHRRHSRRHVRGLPYALSVTAHGPEPAAALEAACRGAVLCGDAAELHTAPDRCKLLALQGMLCGMHPYDAHAAIVGQLTSSGCDPYQADAIAREAVAGAGRMARQFVSDCRPSLGCAAYGVG